MLDNVVVGINSLISNYSYNDYTAYDSGHTLQKEYLHAIQGEVHMQTLTNL